LPFCARDRGQPSSAQQQQQTEEESEQQQMTRATGIVVTGRQLRPCTIYSFEQRVYMQYYEAYHLTRTCMHMSIDVLFRAKLPAVVSHLMQQRRQLYCGVVLGLLVTLLPHVLCTA
jgi:hypothetical protein